MTIEYKCLGQFWRKKGKQIRLPLDPHSRSYASSEYRKFKIAPSPFHFYFCHFLYYRCEIVRIAIEIGIVRKIDTIDTIQFHPKEMFT